MSVRPPSGRDPVALASTISEAKERLRVQVASLRRAIGHSARVARSRDACERLCREPAFLQARTVCAYMPLRYELDVGSAIQVAHAAGKRVALPRVASDGEALSLHAYAPGDSLEQSAFMVREPWAEAARIAEADVDLVLVPGLAFDGQGYRLGFGKGFYDRLLPRLPAATRIGMGFDFQLLAELPHDEFDAPVHCFVSDARTLVCRAQTAP